MRTGVRNVLTAAALLWAAAPVPVVAHSKILYVIVNGRMFNGFDAKATTPHNPNTTVGWSTTVTDDGFVPPSNYSQPDIICHRDGKPAQVHVPVVGGDKMHIQWNGWPKSHSGPALSYLAPCHSSPSGCAGVNKEDLRFFKIDDSAPAFLNASGGMPGFWASDVLIASNNSWQIQIPRGLKAGPYVLRHELIALHYANLPDGAQNYPQCINLWVTDGTGAAKAGVKGVGEGAGVDARSMYKATDPGVVIDVTEPLKTYKIPGPALVSGALPLAMSLQKKSMPTAAGTPVFVRQGTTVAAALPTDA